MTVSEIIGIWLAEKNDPTWTEEHDLRNTYPPSTSKCDCQAPPLTSQNLTPIKPQTSLASQKSTKSDPTRLISQTFWNGFEKLQKKLINGTKNDN